MTLCANNGRSNTVALADILLEGIGADSGGATLGQAANQVLYDVICKIVETVGQSGIQKAGEMIKDGAKSLMDRFRNRNKAQ